MKSEEYRKKLRENITAKYQIAEPDTFEEIESEFNSIANISERIDNTIPKPDFITLKDNKENF